MIKAQEARRITETALLTKDMEEIGELIQKVAKERKRELPLGRHLEDITRRTLEDNGFFVDFDANNNDIIKW